MKQINVGILGFGTVGAGTVRLLLENRDVLTARLGAGLQLSRIADLDTTSDRGIPLPGGVLTDDAEAVLADPDIHIIAELIGGTGVARTFTLKAIANGKHVVTANKALIAEHGNEIIEAARAARVEYCFEASVGGCMPVIKTLRESLAGNRITAVSGILNGTCNYILSKISRDGSEFKDALAEAQEKGFAEADPTLDIEGFDTAHKLAIINSLAQGMAVNLKDIYVEGITRITPLDIDIAREFGYTVKLLAIGKRAEDRVEARVHPTMIRDENPLSSVEGSLNAVTISGDAVGDIMLYGHGAGMMPTASAVVSDMVDIVRNLNSGSAGRIPAMSWQPDAVADLGVLPMDEIETRYYFRFAAVDHPGVLSRISGILGERGISIESVHQRGRDDRDAVPVVMLTHTAREADVKAALAEIKALDMVRQPPMLIRIED